MRNTKGSRYSTIQEGGRSLNPSQFTHLWKPEGRDTASTTGSYRYSYQSIGSTPNPSVGKPSLGRNSSIRNSAHSRSSVWCYQLLRSCVTCYESKIVTIEPVLFIVMFAVYLHKIVSELYIFNEVAKKHDPNVSQCASTVSLNNLNLSYSDEEYAVNLLWSNRIGDVVESDTGILIMIINVVMGACSIFGTLMLGPLSNRFGRKTVLLAILGGLIVQSLITVLITKLSIDMHFFILGAGLRGLTGGVAGVYTVSYSYITEFGMGRKKWVVIRIAIIETFSFVAVSLGLLLGGVAVSELECRFYVPAYMVLGCVACAFMFTAIATADVQGQEFAVSESSSSQLKEPKKVHISPRALLQGAGMFFKSGYPRSRLWLSLLVMVITVLNSSGVTAVITLFLLHQPLAWSPLYIGCYLGMNEFFRGLILVVALPLFLSAGVHDGTIVSLSIVLTLSVNVTLGFVTKTWEAFLVGVLQSAEVLIVPTVKAMLSKAVSPEDKGALFAFISVAQVLSAMLGSAIYIPVYIFSLNRGWPTSNHSSGAAFLLMAMLYSLTLPLMCILSLSEYVAKHRKRAYRHQVLVDKDEVSVPSQSIQSHTPRLQAKHSFDASIGQDLVDREGSMEQKQDWNRDWLEHSYSSLSEYHSHKQ